VALKLVPKCIPKEGKFLRVVMMSCGEKKKSMEPRNRCTYLKPSKQDEEGEVRSYINLKLSIISFAMYHIKMFMLLISM